MAIEIDLLGRFEVRVDGAVCPPEGWRRRQAAALVKVLALTPGHRLHREQVIDRIWPDLSVDHAAPRLHKAAHFARKATGRSDAIVLDGDAITLFPDTPLVVDVERFEADAAEGTEASIAAALARYAGDLLPDDLYEPWADEHRERLRLLHLDLLRSAGRWDDVVAADPTDEDAHLALMRAYVERGDRRAALRQYERMDRALRRELGVGPNPTAIALREELLAEALEEPARVAAPQGLCGREAELAALDRVLDDAAGGRGHTVFVGGPPGIGKSSLVAAARERAAARGWRTGEGMASAIEGSWPYAPVLEALADLCRSHPELLDDLDERYRDEIDRALAGREPHHDDGAGHQRLFVAAGELLRLAAAGRGALLVVDDVHEADDASLRLLHYLARSTRAEPVVLVLAHRTPARAPALDQVRDSLATRGATDLALGPLDRDGVAALAAAQISEPTADVVEEIWELSGGVPFNALELARRWGDRAGDERPAAEALVAALARPTREVLRRVALAGAAFDSDELVALAGVDEEQAFAQLDVALAALVVVRTESGYRFRHGLVRDALVDSLEPHEARALHRDIADRLAVLDASPARIAHHLLEAGDEGAAVPYVLEAGRTEASMGAYADALALVDAVLDAADEADAGRLHELRGDLLLATGRPGAVDAYRAALARSTDADRPRLRAQLARAAVLAGDVELAKAAVDGLDAVGGPDDAVILFAHGEVAFVTGDMEAADAAVEQARRRIATDGDVGWELLDLIALQGLIAHTRGEWFERLNAEMRATSQALGVATAVFDSHLCVAEYLLYGPTPYEQVIAHAESMLEAATRAGALRAVAFNKTLIGEAALLNGDLDRAARELQDAVDLHAEIGATAGEAHSLQRLAEVALARGDRDEARRLLYAALPRARWSSIACHLLQRIYGSLIDAAPDPEAARAAVDTAEAALATADSCRFCEVMLAVPAARACADAGDIADAERWLASAETSAGRWEGTAWKAALAEVRARLAEARGEHDDAERLLEEAARGFDAAGQPLDAARCRARRPAPTG